MRAYRSDEYAVTLAEFGRPRRLESSEGWVLDRLIPGSSDVDAMGCYPLFACRRWDRIGDDLADLDDLVSLVLVADPFGDFDPLRLSETFNRGAVPYKNHHVIELGPTVESLASPHHRRNARKALGGMEVERVERPSTLLNEWAELYAHLVNRHGINGIARFSRDSFAGLLAMPSLVAFRAERAGATAGMVLWLVDGDVAYYHLGAYSESGYAACASYALFWRSIEWFTGRVRWLDLGAGAGVEVGSAGLDRFKRGWSNGTRIAYLCRHVFRVDRYDALARARGTEGVSFFPTYRASEAASPALVEGVRP